jgi:hypothetical protein
LFPSVSLVDMQIRHGTVHRDELFKNSKPTHTYDCKEGNIITIRAIENELSYNNPCDIMIKFIKIPSGATLM